MKSFRRVLFLLVVSCLLLGACGDVDDDSGHALKALTPSGLGNAPGVPGGLGAGAADPNGLGAGGAVPNGLGTGVGDPGGLGTQSGAPGGLGGTGGGGGGGGGTVDAGTLAAEICHKGKLLACEDFEKIPGEFCISLVKEELDDDDLTPEVLACVSGANSCDQLEECGESGGDGGSAEQEEGEPPPEHDAYVPYYQYDSDAYSY